MLPSLSIADASGTEAGQRQDESRFRRHAVGSLDQRRSRSATAPPTAPPKPAPIISRPAARSLSPQARPARRSRCPCWEAWSAPAAKRLPCRSAIRRAPRWPARRRPARSSTTSARRRSPTSGFQFQVTSDWGTGFRGQITATNSSQQTISNWQLQFTFAANITSIWDATIVSHTGNQYVVENAGWNASIAPGASISFGFNASPGQFGHRADQLCAGQRRAAARPAAARPARHRRRPTIRWSSIRTRPPSINVLANDTDPAGYALSVTAITQPTKGTAVLNTDGTVTYTPNSGYTGTDAFSYTVSDGHGGTASALVSLTVGTPAATAAWPAQFFAPYVDVTLYPTYNLVSTTQTEGIKYYTLAFITADSNNQPAWGGYTQLRDQRRRVRHGAAAAGGLGAEPGWRRDGLVRRCGRPGIGPGDHERAAIDGRLSDRGHRLQPDASRFRYRRGGRGRPRLDRSPLAGPGRAGANGRGRRSSAATSGSRCRRCRPV